MSHTEFSDVWKAYADYHATGLDILSTIISGSVWLATFYLFVSWRLKKFQMWKDGLGVTK